MKHKLNNARGFIPNFIFNFSSTNIAKVKLKHGLPLDRVLCDPPRVVLMGVGGPF